MLFGAAFWILLIILIIAGVTRFARSSRDVPEARRRSSEREILDERYARDELEREEYLRRKRDILGPET